MTLKKEKEEETGLCLKYDAGKKDLKTLDSRTQKNNDDKYSKKSLPLTDTT